VFYLAVEKALFDVGLAILLPWKM